MAGFGEHWEHIYASQPSTGLSWYEREPTTSLRLIDTFATGPSAVIDIGGGASSLVDGLLERGYTDVTVLDVSEHALAEVRDRLGASEDRVTLLHQDLLRWHPSQRYDVWHDRAVFHFLTEPADRDQYLANADSAVADGGIVVLGTFAEDGPTSCSGLPVSRYSPPDLGAVFSPSFALVHHEREEHVTPGGIVQPLTWVVLRRTELMR